MVGREESFIIIIFNYYLLSIGTRNSNKTKIKKKEHYSFEFTNQ